MSQNENEPKVILQRLERSIDFWIEDREDYPPSIRGAVPDLTDLTSDLRDLIQSIAVDERYPDLELRRVLWFEDKNEKLDQACEQSKAAFRPHAVDTANGLISPTDPRNTVMASPTLHRLVVSDEFAANNYERQSHDLLIDDDDDDDSDASATESIGPHSWKRKIAQTLKPWSTIVNDQVQHARPEGDLLIALNSLLSRTKHGWLVVDLYKLRERRGAIMSYARTFEYQRKRDQAFEFMLQLFGTASGLQKRIGNSLKGIAYLCIEIDEDGEAYVTKASVYRDDESCSTAAITEVAIPIETEVVMADGKPSQLKIKKTGKYYDSKIAPAVEPGKKKSIKIDLRKANTDQKRFRFDLRIELNAPLLVASSGDAMIFELDDMLTRFIGTTLHDIRKSSSDG